MNSGSDEDPVAVNVDELVRRHQRGSRSLYYRNPFRLIRDFVICFQYIAGGKAKLATRPDDSLLEVLAEAFRRYLRGKGSLDAAFGLKLVGKGRRSPREQYRIHVQSFGAQAIFKGLRLKRVPQKLAIEQVAKAYQCSESKARDLIFGKRSVRTKKS